MSDATSLPSGLVTFMFTDIVGSTDMKPKMPGATSGERQEAFREKVKAPHDAIITECVGARGGGIVKSTGDGFFIAFADAQKAVLCAVEIQQRIGDAAIFTPDGVLKIRIGLNTGHADCIAGDYTATAVDKAARVESKAGPGQVFLSGETRAHIADNVRGVSTTSAGLHEMKGVGKEELFAASFDGSSATPPTPAVTPPVAAHKTNIPHNLPSLQPFFGREDELQKIATALDPKSRGWGTLVDGDGGMGKTSLAVCAAYEVPPAHFGRIVFASAKEHEQDDHGQRALGAFAFPSWLKMLNKIAAELKLPEIAKAPENERAVRLQEELASRDTLLVLDNLETLTPDEQNELFNFLEFLPAGCKALLTSREFIGNRTLALDLKKLGRGAAMQMLDEISRHNEEFALSSPKNRDDLYDATHGNALLMRWVAGQVGHGHCTTTADALDYLRSGPQGNDALEFIFGDVLTSLGEPEIRLLATLTWPAQPIPVATIAEISGVPELDSRRFLKTLTNRSLVVPGKEETEYTLVPMVGDFLRRKKPEVVLETGDRLEKRAYALIIENGYDEHDRFPALEAAWPCIAPALSLFLAGDNARLQTICTTLDSFLFFTGRWDERLAVNQQAETKALMVRDLVSAGSRAYLAGVVYFSRGQAEEVLCCADRAGAYWSSPLAGPVEHATAIRLRGAGYETKKDYPAALAAYRKARDILLGLPKEIKELSIAYNAVANAERLLRDFEAARRDYHEAIRIACAVGYGEGVATSTANLAAALLAEGDGREAECLASEALLLAEKMGRQELIARVCHYLAQALIQQGKAAEALPHARRAVEIYIRLGSPDLGAATETLRECEEAPKK